MYLFCETIAVNRCTQVETVVLIAFHSLYCWEHWFREAKLTRFLGFFIKNELQPIHL